MDEGTKTVFYRLMVPTFKKEYNEDVVEAFINTSQVVCKTFATVIEALATGTMSLQEILQKAEEIKK